MSLLLFLHLNFFTPSVQADTVKIHTSAVCEMCKDFLEKDLMFEKGVRSVRLDLDSKDLTVVYDPEKSDPEKIRQRISKIGYDADTVKRNPKAYNRLPKCCRQEGCGAH
ncbi:MAG: hypothetical protein RL213_292 [Bacteroidota bacterium]|jgi:copper chaperone CopZ